MEKIQFIQLTPNELTSLILTEIKSEIEALVINNESNKDNQKEFLTRQETANLFGVSLVCLHQWSKKGIIKPYKLGNRTYYKYEELKDTLLKSNME